MASTNNDQKLRDLTTILIQIIVWFELLWATVFLAGAVFQWSGLTDQLAVAFFGGGFCAVVVLVSLVLLNITVNLNIISKAQTSSSTGGDGDKTPSLSFPKIIGTAAALIGLIVASLWFAEWRLYRKKISGVQVKLESVNDVGLLNEAATLIKSDGKLRDLDAIREALSANIQSGSRLSFIFPLKVKNIDIYYEMHAWWHSKNDDAKISEASLAKFVPSGNEQKKWERLLKGEINSFSSVDGSNVRGFRKVQTENGPVVLLIDTSRRSDYARSSFNR